MNQNKSFDGFNISELIHGNYCHLRILEADMDFIMERVSYYPNNTLEEIMEIVSSPFDGEMDIHGALFCLGTRCGFYRSINAAFTAAIVTAAASPILRDLTPREFDLSLDWKHSGTHCGSGSPFVYRSKVIEPKR